MDSFVEVERAVTEIAALCVMKASQFSPNATFEQAEKEFFQKSPTYFAAATDGRRKRRGQSGRIPCQPACFGDEWCSHTMRRRDPASALLSERGSFFNATVNVICLGFWVSRHSANTSPEMSTPENCTGTRQPSDSGLS